MKDFKFEPYKPTAKCFRCSKQVSEICKDCDSPYCEPCHDHLVTTCIDCGHDATATVADEYMCEGCIEGSGYCRCDTCTSSGDPCQGDCEKEFCQGCLIAPDGGFYELYPFF